MAKELFLLILLMMGFSIYQCYQYLKLKKEYVEVKEELENIKKEGNK